MEWVEFIIVRELNILILQSLWALVSTCSFHLDLQKGRKARSSLGKYAWIPCATGSLYAGVYSYTFPSWFTLDKNLIFVEQACPVESGREFLLQRVFLH